MIEEFSDIFYKTRKIACPSCSCNVDFSDLCAECPYKKWKNAGARLCGEYKEYYKINEDTQNKNSSEEENSKEFPSVQEMAKNLGKAMLDEARAFLSGKDVISDEEFQKRIDICTSCNFFSKKSKRCLRCGCYLSLKAKMRGQKCPIQKW
jgi:hypothetical protein